MFGLMFGLRNRTSAVEAGTGDNVSGYAWSENIGWISFNCTNTGSCGTSNYGVDIDSETGLFSGYTWSENIGWIDFAPAGPYPASPNYSACLDFLGNGQVCDDISGTNKAGGWARALAYGDGWDGWIKLRGSNYGVKFTQQSGELSGYAWSDQVIGWISFDGDNYGVVTIASQPPSVSAAGETWNNCSVKGKSIPILNWNYVDGTQAAYQVQIDNTSASFPTPEVDTGKVISSSASYAPSFAFNWDTNYWWRVKAKNQSGVWSNWSNTDNFNTPEHAYPWSEFSWEPAEPTQGETAEFDSSEAEAFGGAGISSYLWTITQGAGAFVDSTTNASANPRIQFSASNNKVELQVTDSDGYSCDKEEDITAQLPLPEYKEVAPTSWLEKIFAGLSVFLTRMMESATM